MRRHQAEKLLDGSARYQWHKVTETLLPRVQVDKANRTGAGHVASHMTGRCSMTLLTAEAEEPVQTRVLLGAVTGLD